MSAGLGSGRVALASADPMRGPVSEEISGDLEDWFVDDHGNILLPTSEPRPPKSSLRRVRSGESTTTMNSISTVIPSYGVIDLSLEDVCNYIDDHRSLQPAQIISTECYFERSGAVMHRFVILELQRHRRKNIWLRLDRRRGKGVSILKFLGASGVTEANDRALLSANKQLLVNEAMRENQQFFEDQPNLHRFSRLLRVITEEIVEYRIWPENCWFFCSLIQQYLAGSQTGWFIAGKLKHSNLANNIRIRISARVWESRPTVAISKAGTTVTLSNGVILDFPPLSPESEEDTPPPTNAGENSAGTHSNDAYAAPTTPHPSRRLLHSPLNPKYSSSLSSTTSSNQHPNQPQQSERPAAYISEPAIYDLSGWTGLGPDAIATLRVKVTDSEDSVDEGVQKNGRDCLYLNSMLRKRNAYAPAAEVRDSALLLAHALGEVDIYLWAISDNASSLCIRKEIVRVHRFLVSGTPLSDQGNLSDQLRQLGIALHEEGQSAEACDADEEALAIRREEYHVRPDLARAKLAWTLHFYAIHLNACERFSEAAEVDAEAVHLRRRLYAEDPDKYRDELATSLEHLNIHLGLCGRLDEALEASREALELRRTLFAKDSGLWRKTLVDCLHNHAISLDEVGQWGSAGRVQEECERLRAELEDEVVTDDLHPSSDKDDGDSMVVRL